MTFEDYLGGLRSYLSRLSVKHRIAFAAWCCERLLPHYEELANFLGTQPDRPPRYILDYIWQHCLGYEMTEDKVKALQETCEALDVGEENCCEHWARAIDAVGALWLALDACKHESADRATQAAENLLNGVDQQLMERFMGLFYSLQPLELRAIQRKIETHPLMKAEQQKQLEGLKFLEKCEHLSETKIEMLRHSGK